MKTAIVYYSQHHGNTKKLVDAIANAHEVTLVDVTKESAFDLSSFDRIGIASGVYAGNLAKPLLKFLEEHLPENKEVFFIYTSAMTGEGALSKARSITMAKNCKEIGAYYSKGYNTFGPFKLVGGTSKGHPTNEEILGAVAFYNGI